MDFSDNRATKPFNTSITDSTVERYAATWASLLSFIINGLDESDEERRFVLSDHQEEQFGILKPLLLEAEETMHPDEESALYAAIVEASYSIIGHPLSDVPAGGDHPLTSFTVLSNINPGN